MGRFLERALFKCADERSASSFSKAGDAWNNDGKAIIISVSKACG